jgi:hypothetical protein
MRALSPEQGDCSSACDVILAPVRRLEAAVVHAVIDDGPAWDHCPACRCTRRRSVACQAIDALALAVRAKAPIYATRRAINHAGGNGNGAAQRGNGQHERPLDH